MTMARWTKETCSACAGHGIVSAYTADGSDFTGAKDCDACNGNGQVSISDRGVIAQYPGGPLLGRLSKQELAARS